MRSAANSREWCDMRVPVAWEQAYSVTMAQALSVTIASIVAVVGLLFLS